MTNRLSNLSEDEAQLFVEWAALALWEWEERRCGGRHKSSRWSDAYEQTEQEAIRLLNLCRNILTDDEWYTSCLGTLVKKFGK